jgi:hypothetical protein
MTVSEAIKTIRAAGELHVEGGTIHTRIPKNGGKRIKQALSVIRENKELALATLDGGAATEAAWTFVVRAGARLVDARYGTAPATEAGFVIEVPEVNDDDSFRAALRVLGMDGVPVVGRTEALAMARPAAGTAEMAPVPTGDPSGGQPSRH